MITYRRIEEEELCIKLFDRFIRHQVVTKCWRKEEGEWVIKDVPFCRIRFVQADSCMAHFTREI